MIAELAVSALACVTTVGQPGDVNFFQDGCEPPVRLVIQSERIGGQPCPGPHNRSFPINEPGSPIRYMRRGGRITLSVDQRRGHPCGSGHYTFAGLMRHLESGWQLPRPSVLTTSYRVRWDAVGNARLIVAAQVWWRSKRHPNGIGHLVEINTGATRAAAYDHDPHPWVIGQADEFAGLFDYAILAPRPFGIAVKSGVTRTITVRWGRIFDRLIADRVLDPPIDGLVVTQAVYAAVETVGKSRATVTVETL